MGDTSLRHLRRLDRPAGGATDRRTDPTCGL